MSGLRHPSDLRAWEKWARGRAGVLGRLRGVKALVRPTDPPPATLWLPDGQEPRALVIMDNLSPSCRLVIHDPLRHVDDLSRVAVLTQVEDPELPGGDWHRVEFVGPSQIPGSVEQVLSLGAFNWLSSLVEPWAKGRGMRFIVVQHGLMTPWAPPLNDGDHLLAWSEADAHFWSADRPSITWEVVGSQMLWQAGHAPRVELRNERPIMLGQLHGIELPRLDKLRTYERFCRSHGADYRPHPVESDALSRAGHQWLRRRGVQFEDSGLPLPELGRPVVSIFSTGTLEAAQRGLPAWVHHPNAPAWVRDFWQRNRLKEYGEEPTPAWELGEEEPAALIASAVQQ
ncbi:prephenate dehydrogenase [Aestuariimicrobium sp. Y1814]|uniref:prephenate dehydrogenase n=1 Tax=Aestuariimicrobium sp. Y1814 TaxID=3418742 RepID=UPI003DA78377